MLKKTVLSLAIAASMGLMSASVSAADFGSLLGGSSSGAKIGGDNTMKIKFDNVIALGVDGGAKAMVGHISDGSSIGGNNNMDIQFDNAIALGVGGGACVAIGTVGGNCN